MKLNSQQQQKVKKMAKYKVDLLMAVIEDFEEVNERFDVLEKEIDAITENLDESFDDVYKNKPNVTNEDIETIATIAASKIKVPEPQSYVLNDQDTETIATRAAAKIKVPEAKIITKETIIRELPVVRETITEKETIKEDEETKLLVEELVQKFEDLKEKFENGVQKDSGRRFFGTQNGTRFYVNGKKQGLINTLNLAGSGVTLAYSKINGLDTITFTASGGGAVSSVFGRTGIVAATSGDYNTSQVTENTNLYFTNARAIASTLTSYTSGAGTISATDSVLQAIQKLNGNAASFVTGVTDTTLTKIGTTLGINLAHANTWTANQTFSTIKWGSNNNSTSLSHIVSVDTLAGLHITNVGGADSNAAYLALTALTGISDQNVWTFYVNGTDGSFAFQPINDAFNSGSNVFQILRDGATIINSTVSGDGVNAFNITNDNGGGGGAIQILNLWPDSSQGVKLILGDGSTGAIMDFNNFAQFGRDNTTDLFFATQGAERMRFDINGNTQISNGSLILNSYSDGYLQVSGNTVNSVSATSIGTAGKFTQNLFNHFADGGNTTTGETTLYTDTLAAGQLATNGDKITALYSGTFVSSATATRDIRVYFGGTVILDTSTLTTATAEGWEVHVTVIRESSSVVRCQATIVSSTTLGASAFNDTTYTRITGLTLANTQIIKITGQAGSTGAATNDIVAKLGYVSYQPA